jgi:hypothetical protein
MPTPSSTNPSTGTSTGPNDDTEEHDLENEHGSSQNLVEVVTGLLQAEFVAQELGSQLQPLS